MLERGGCHRMSAVMKAACIVQPSHPLLKACIRTCAASRAISTASLGLARVASRLAQRSYSYCIEGARIQFCKMRPILSLPFGNSAAVRRVILPFSAAP